MGPKQLIAYVLTLCFLMGSFACADETPIRLTRTERARIDTLYIRQVDTLKAFTDSMCYVYNDLHLSNAVDSIIKLRKLEAEMLKKRSNPIIDQQLSK